MTGPEHYREAEQFLGYARDLYGTNIIGVASEAAAAIAQVHATLALAAATAGLDAIEGPAGGSATGRSVQDWNQWKPVISPDVAS